LLQLIDGGQNAHVTHAPTPSAQARPAGARPATRKAIYTNGNGNGAHHPAAVAPPAKSKTPEPVALPPGRSSEIPLDGDAMGF
jgi:hypothetical protein